MRCYLVTGPGAKRYAATNADARATRDALVEQLDCKKKDVEIEQTDIPVAKADLLEFINTLCAETDAKDAQPPGMDGQQPPRLDGRAQARMDGS